MKRYLLKVWYLGTQFAGSQRQPDARTVEGEILQVLKNQKYIVDEQTSLFRAGLRTDVGVHAICAPFTFDSDKDLYLGELNTFLPEDIGIWAYSEVNLDFHPRFDALNREYRYLLVKNLKKPLNVDLIRQGLQILQGKHDFRLFMKYDNSKPDQSTILTLIKADIEEYSDYLVFSFQSDHFLWQQVRRMVQFLVYIGEGKKNLADLESCFTEKRTSNPREHKDGPISPDGLILWDIQYQPEIQFTIDSKVLQKMQKSLEQQAQIMALRAFSYKYFTNTMENIKK